MKVIEHPGTRQLLNGVNLSQGVMYKVILCSDSKNLGKIVMRFENHVYSLDGELIVNIHSGLTYERLPTGTKVTLEQL